MGIQRASLRRFVSADFTPSVAGLVTIAHGLGVVPDILSIWYRCVTASAGYSIGDIVRADEKFTVYADASNVYVRFNDVAAVIVDNKTTGAASTGVPTDWAIFIEAMA